MVVDLDAVLRGQPHTDQRVPAQAGQVGAPGLAGARARHVGGLADRARDVAAVAAAGADLVVDRVAERTQGGGVGVDQRVAAVAGAAEQLLVLAGLAAGQRDHAAEGVGAVGHRGRALQHLDAREVALVVGADPHHRAELGEREAAAVVEHLHAVVVDAVVAVDADLVLPGAQLVDVDSRQVAQAVGQAQRGGVDEIVAGQHLDRLRRGLEVLAAAQRAVGVAEGVDRVDVVDARRRRGPLPTAFRRRTRPGRQEEQRAERGLAAARAAHQSS